MVDTRHDGTRGRVRKELDLKVDRDIWVCEERTVKLEFEAHLDPEPAIDDPTCSEPIISHTPGCIVHRWVRKRVVDIGDDEHGTLRKSRPACDPELRPGREVRDVADGRA